MPLALITTSPAAVVTTFEATTVDLDLPGIGFVSSVGDGYTSPGGAYKLVAFAHFVPPAGTVITGSAVYTVDEFFVVTETYTVFLLTPNYVISNVTFRNLFTPSERLDLATASLTDGQLRLFIDDYLVHPTVDLTSANVTTGCAYLVSQSLMTQERVDEILAYRNP